MMLVSENTKMDVTHQSSLKVLTSSFIKGTPNFQIQMYKNEKSTMQGKTSKYFGFLKL